MRSTLLLAALGLVLVLPGLPAPLAPAPVPAPWSTHATLPAARLLDDGRACKPRGPVAVDLASHLAPNGTLELDWVITPLVDVVDLSFRLALPPGWVLTQGEPDGALDGAAGAATSGGARLRPPRGRQAAEVVLHVEGRLGGDPEADAFGVDRVLLHVDPRVGAGALAATGLVRDPVRAPGRELLSTLHRPGR